MREYGESLLEHDEELDLARSTTQAVVGQMQHDRTLYTLREGQLTAENLATQERLRQSTIDHQRALANASSLVHEQIVETQRIAQNKVAEYQ